MMWPDPSKMKPDPVPLPARIITVPGSTALATSTRFRPDWLDVGPLLDRGFELPFVPGTGAWDTGLVWVPGGGAAISCSEVLPASSAPPYPAPPPTRRAVSAA